MAGIIDSCEKICMDGCQGLKQIFKDSPVQACTHQSTTFSCFSNEAFKGLCGLPGLPAIDCKADLK